MKGIEIKQLIRRVNSYNNNDIFPSKLNITYLSQPELTITSGDSYSYSWIKNSNYYNISFEYSNFNEYITTIIIEDTTN